MGRTSVCIRNVDGDGLFEVIIYDENDRETYRNKVEKFTVDLLPGVIEEWQENEDPPIYTK